MQYYVKYTSCDVTMSRKKGNKGLLYDVDDGETDPPVLDAYSSQGGSPPRTLSSGGGYGTNSITVAVQQPGKGKTQFVTSVPATDNTCILTPASSPSSEEEGRVDKFGETQSGKSSRTASETRLLVPEEGSAITETCDINTKLVDPDTAGAITLWNGVKMKATEFICKVSSSWN